ncbi:hypothetical protein D3C81_1683310 [compost metagenome]
MATLAPAALRALRKEATDMAKAEFISSSLVLVGNFDTHKAPLNCFVGISTVTGV